MREFFTGGFALLNQALTRHYNSILDKLEELGYGPEVAHLHTGRHPRLRRLFDLHKHVMQPKELTPRGMCSRWHALPF